MFCENEFNAAIARAGETRSDAAKVIGIAASTLIRKTSGTSDFSRIEIERFCCHYGVEPNGIFFAKDSAPKQTLAKKQNELVRGETNA